MERTDIHGTALKVSPVAIGTWAIGGWMWGGTDEAESIATIHAAFEHGINIIDTAPVYGFGRSEEIVGRAIAEGRLRSEVFIATKVGLQWEGGRVCRNASRARIVREIEDSLRRLRTDYIDIYHVHWPDPLITIEETAVQKLDRLARQRFGKRVIHLAVRWMLDQGITTALWGARHPGQLQPVDEVTGWSLDASTKAEIDRILREAITDPVGPEFMAPPPRSVAA
jgi:aryl-alcohol dehydrogenase-like predicted oxidoreductase